MSGSKFFISEKEFDPQKRYLKDTINFFFDPAPFIAVAQKFVKELVSIALIPSFLTILSTAEEVGIYQVASHSYEIRNNECFYSFIAYAKKMQLVNTP